MSIYNTSSFTNFKPTWLYIKQHSITGKLYFGKTTVNDPTSYYGSGVVWTRHINKHGKQHVVTLWTELFTSIDDCTRFALEFSEKMNIVESKSWANLKVEDGRMGGSYLYTNQQKEQLSKTIKEKQWTGEKGITRRNLHSTKFSGLNNPSAKTYKIVTSSNEEFIICGGLKEFCKEQNLTYDTVRQWINKGVVRITNSKDNSLYLSKTKRTILGWEIIEISKCIP
jgi:hypothetical protein